MPLTFTLEVGCEPIPGYRLLTPRGGSWSSEVWVSTSPTGQTVALKFLDPSRNAQREQRAADVIRQMNHPGLLRVDRTWVFPEAIVQAIELANGSLMDLHNLYVTQQGTFIPVQILCQHLLQVAEILDHLNVRQHMFEGQKVGFQHCNLKPTNILIFQDRVRLSDFGRMTATAGNLVPYANEGGLGYAAPEMIRGYVSDRVDQYALALIYYVLRTGMYPFGVFPEETATTVDRSQMDLSALPPMEAQVIERALAPLPRDRWLSCSMMMRELIRRAVPSGSLLSQAMAETRVDISASGSTAMGLPRMK